MAIQQWFNRLKRQEQILVLILAVVLVAYLLVVMVFRPMSQQINSLALQNQQSVETLAAVKALAAEYQLLQKSGAARHQSKQNLTRLIDTLVKKHQLSMSRFQPSSSGDVQVRFENAAYSHILAWLHDLEHNHGVLIKDLSITMGGVSGIVNVSVRMRQGV